MCSNNNLLPCPVCCYPIFSNFESLCVNLMNATKRPLTCPICNELFLGLEKFTLHLYSHSITATTSDENQTNITKNEINPIDTKPIIINNKNCDDNVPSENCIINENKSINSLNIETNQLLTHQPEICRLNSKNLTSASGSSSSLLQQPQIDEPECKICFCKFRSIELKSMHMKLVHDIEIETDERYSFGNNYIDNENKFQCHLCAKRFKMKGSLRVHLRVVHSYGSTSSECVGSSSNGNGIQLLQQYGYHSGIIGKIENNRLADGDYSYLNSNDSQSQQMIDSKDGIISLMDVNLWECETCGKYFTTKYFLKKHKRLHTGEMPYKCEICNKTFTFQQSYHKHLLYHNDNKPYICNTCGRAFKELSTLHNHERIHSGEKPFKCETCDKSFRQRVSYLVHKRIHTGVMPYKCTICDKSFRYKVSQRTHKCINVIDSNLPHQQQQLQELSETIVQSTDTIIKTSKLSSINTLTTDYIIDDNLTNQTLDELVAESCTKLGICGHNNNNNTIITNLVDDQQNHNVSSSSPTAELENLCIYSPIQFPDLSDI